MRVNSPAARLRFFQALFSARIFARYSGSSAYRLLLFSLRVSFEDDTDLRPQYPVTGPRIEKKPGFPGGSGKHDHGGGSSRPGCSWDRRMSAAKPRAAATSAGRAAPAPRRRHVACVATGPAPRRAHGPAGGGMEAPHGSSCAVLENAPFIPVSRNVVNIYLRYVANIKKSNELRDAGTASPRRSRRRILRDFAADAARPGWTWPRAPLEGSD